MNLLIYFLYVSSITISYKINEHILREAVGKINKEGYCYGYYRLIELIKKERLLGPLNYTSFIPLYNLYVASKNFKNKENIKNNLYELVKEKESLKSLPKHTEKLESDYNAYLKNLSYINNRQNIEVNIIEDYYNKIIEIDNNEEITAKEKLKLIRYYLEILKEELKDHQILNIKIISGEDFQEMQRKLTKKQ